MSDEQDDRTKSAVRGDDRERLYEAAKPIIPEDVFEFMRRAMAAIPPSRCVGEIFLHEYQRAYVDGVESAREAKIPVNAELLEDYAEKLANQRQRIRELRLQHICQVINDGNIDLHSGVLCVTCDTYFLIDELPRGLYCPRCYRGLCFPQARELEIP